MEQPVSRRERERQTRRLTMLEAARVVIAEKGLKRATLDEIAQRAEFGKGTIYNYFPNGKEEMLFAILDEVYSDLHAITEEAFATAEAIPFRDRLRRYVESFLSYFMRQRDLFVIVMKEANRIAFGDEESKSRYFKSNLDRLVGVLQPAIDDAMASGELKPFPAESVAHMILGNVHGYLRYYCVRGDADAGPGTDMDAESVCAAEFLCAILLDGMADTRTATQIHHGLGGAAEEAS
ncbi:MAG TPA: TetR/AcrR family transcriptional regulator [Rhodothermales bacterium]|nr:TetR/AcrR family transcriptional regulator [Rhodothermales bacterium]